MHGVERRSTPLFDDTGVVHSRASAAVEARGVIQRYRNTEVLGGVDLAVAPGEIHALLGPNGAGKTTLLRALMGLLVPTAGKVLLLGRPVSRRDVGQRMAVGLIPSGDRSLYLRISGLENLRFFARMYGMRGRAAMERCRELLEAVDLADAARRPVSTYSHGMQKRLVVARALLPDPRVLLVDEVTHDLDPANAARVRGLVRDAAARGVAVIWTTQRIEEVQGLAERVTVLTKGEVRFSGTIAAFAARARNRRYRLRLEPATSGPAPSRLDPHLLGAVGTLTAIDNEAEGEYLLELRDGFVVGDAMMALWGLAQRVLDCTPERPSAEAAFLDITRERP